MTSHRRTVVTDKTGGEYDVQNQARCTRFGQRHCNDSTCPRHEASAYADHMARHATDSIMPQRYYIRDSKGILAAIEQTQHSALKRADYLTRQNVEAGPFRITVV